VTRVGCLAFVAFLAVSCGAPSAKLSTLNPSRACLQAKGLRTDQKLGADFIAGTATGGAFRAHLGRNFVTIVFSETVDRADAINDAYHRFRGQNVGIEDVLKQQANVVMLWHEHPSDADQARVTGCLK
jgi:hypothetical protein